MRAINQKKLTSCLISLLLLAFYTCGHDSKRDNPLDPALTPAVQLEVSVEDSTGVAVLTWTPFAGEAAFAEYRIVRNIADRTTVDTLAVLPSLAQTSYVDSSLVPETSYSYRVLSVNTIGLEVASEAHIVRLGTPSGVQIELLGLDSRTASASLSWSQYTGRDFSAYQLLRTAGSQPQVVAEVASRLDTTFVDTGLNGNIEYSYQVAVLTDRDESISSNTVTGVFHQLVDSWPVDVADGGYVRLYREDGNVVALVSERQRIRRMTFDSNGAVLKEQVLLQNRWLDVTPFTVGLSTTADGTRYLGFLRKTQSESGADEQTAMLLAFDEQGAPSYRAETTTMLDLQDVAEELPDYDPTAAYHFINLNEGTYDNLIIDWDGGERLSREFTSGNLDDWTSWGCNPVTATDVYVEAGELVVEVTSPFTFIRLMRDAADVSHNLVLETDFAIAARELFAVLLVHRSNPCFIDDDGVFDLTGQAIYVQLAFGFQRMFGVTWAEGSETQTTVAQPHRVVPGLPYRLRMEVDEERAQATVLSPLVWSESVESDLPLGVTGLAGLEDYLVFATTGRTYGTYGNFGTSFTLPLEASASEVRIWETADGQRLGVCLPERHEIRIGDTEVTTSIGTRLDWPFHSSDDQTNLVLGSSSLGQGEGEFFLPTSFDASADGRIYVLDAGNARIQSFTDDGAYISQWGQRGSGNDEFDFGASIDVAELAGSLIVGEDSFIYVADVANKRIQKFAP